MDQKELLKKELTQEKKNQYKSAAYTGGLIVILLFLSMFWVAMAGPVPPIQEEEYVTLGRVDFGQTKAGKNNVNNFEKPSPTPADKPKATEEVKITEPKPAPSESRPDNPITSEKPADVAVDKPVETDKPDPSASNSNNKPEKQEREIEELNPFDNDPGDNNNAGGSQQGDEGVDGNRGNPNANVLDPNGMFAFGNGVGAGSGREPLSTPNPVYPSTSADSKITFSFVIKPDGSVAYVKTPVASNRALVKAGMDAIKKWKFTRVNSAKGNQTAKVTITFFQK